MHWHPAPALSPQRHRRTGRPPQMLSAPALLRLSDRPAARLWLPTAPRLESARFPQPGRARSLQPQRLLALAPSQQTRARSRPRTQRLWARPQYRPRRRGLRRHRPRRRGQVPLPRPHRRPAQQTQAQSGPAPLTLPALASRRQTPTQSAAARSMPSPQALRQPPRRQLARVLSRQRRGSLAARRRSRRSLLGGHPINGSQDRSCARSAQVSTFVPALMSRL